MKELKTGWYNKELERIKIEDRNLGAVLFVTKEFKHLYDFINKLDFDTLSNKLQRPIDNIIIDVSNFWVGLTIKVYSMEV